MSLSCVQYVTLTYSFDIRLSFLGILSKSTKVLWRSQMERFYCFARSLKLTFDVLCALKNSMAMNPSQTDKLELPGTWLSTDKVLQNNRPCITLAHKDTQEWSLTDIAVAADQSIIRTRKENVEKHHELTFQMRRIRGALRVTDTYRDWCS